MSRAVVAANGTTADGTYSHGRDETVANGTVTTRQDSRGWDDRGQGWHSNGQPRQEARHPRLEEGAALLRRTTCKSKYFSYFERTSGRVATVSCRRSAPPHPPLLCRPIRLRRAVTFARRRQAPIRLPSPHACRCRSAIELAAVACSPLPSLRHTRAATLAPPCSHRHVCRSATVLAAVVAIMALLDATFVRPHCRWQATLPERLRRRQKRASRSWRRVAQARAHCLGPELTSCRPGGDGAIARGPHRCDVNPDPSRERPVSGG